MQEKRDVTDINMRQISEHERRMIKKALKTRESKRMKREMDLQVKKRRGKWWCKERKAYGEG